MSIVYVWLHLHCLSQGVAAQTVLKSSDDGGGVAASLCNWLRLWLDINF